MVPAARDGSDGEVRGVGEGEDAAGGHVGADRNPVLQVSGGFDEAEQMFHHVASGVSRIIIPFSVVQTRRA